ncbi:MAG: hypothetical protein ACP5NC_05885 [Nitrososphaeria archaeon]
MYNFSKIYVSFFIILILVFAFAQPFVVLVQPAHADEFVYGGETQSNGPFTLTFTEIGLPNATVWYATVNGTTKNSLAGEGGSSGSISFVLSKGTYSYSVGGVSGFSASPSSGSISLTSSVNIPVRFTIINGSTFNVTFVESGLPIGVYSISNAGIAQQNISWSVSLGNREMSSRGTTLTFSNVSAGNYSWIAHTVNVSGAYYVPQPASGNMSVPDQLTVFVHYTEYAKVRIEPDNGLFGDVTPAGTHWYRVGTVVNLTAVPGFESTFFEWSYTPMEFFRNPTSQNTSFTVMGPGNVTAEFATAVGFRESGIPQGGSGTSYTWGFDVYPQSNQGLTGVNSSQWMSGQNTFTAVNSSAIILYATNGSYKYVVSPAYVQNPSATSYVYTPTVINRSMIVDTQMLVFSIEFVPGVPVNFTESGLPKGTPWAIEINGTYHNFIAGYNSPPVYLPPGTPITFSVQPITGYTITPESGVMSFNGPSTFSVSFAPVSPKGQIYSQYSGYFYSGLQVFNVFGFNGSWGSAVPAYVTATAGSITVPFSPPSVPGGYWTSQQVNMGNFNSSFDLVVHAAYPNGSILNYTYPVSVINSPPWLTALANSPAVSVSVSQPVQEWGSPYTVTFDTNLATDTLLTVNANLNIISGAYDFLPSVPLTLTLTSSGDMSISTSINPNSVTVKLDSVSLTMGGSISLSGSFELSQNTVVWKSASVDLAFNTLVSTTVPVAGINVPGTDYTVGIWLKIGAGPDFSVLVQLQPTTNGNYEITNGLPVMVSGVTGGVGVTIAISVNGGLTNIVSAGGGGGLTFMQYIGVPPEPLDMGGNITGTVFISATAFGISWTIWKDTGLLYSWGASNDPAVNQQGNVTYVKAYFNLTGYNSQVWESGSWNGTLVHDIYPYTTFSTAPGIGGDYLFYTYYNTSTPVHPLTVRGIFMSNERNATPVAMPNFGNFETTGPEAFALPNGSVELLYAALPESQITNSSSLFSVNRVLLQASRYNGSSWSAPVNVTASGVANSYTYRDGYALVIETPSLFSTSSSVQEYKVSTGSLISSMPLANASYFEYFNPELSTAVVRFSNMSYAILNLNKGTVTKITPLPNTRLLQVGSAANSSDMIYYLLSANGKDVFELYNVTSSRVVYTQNLSENAYPAYFVYGSPESALITGQEPSGVSVYDVNLNSNSSMLYSTSYIPNMTFYRASDGGGNLYIYSMNSYGQPYQPLYNLNALIIPFSAPPAPLLSLEYNGSGIRATWSVPQHYKLTGVYLTVNGLQVASGSASGTAFYPAKSPGNYVFTATSENVIGNSSTSNSMGIYPINFTESGLQANSTWSVTVLGASGQKLQFSAQTSSNHVSILVPNGKYAYNITAPSGYRVSSETGEVQVNGTSAAVSLTFSKPSSINLIIIAVIIIIATIIIAAVLLIIRKK